MWLCGHIFRKPCINLHLKQQSIWIKTCLNENYKFLRWEINVVEISVDNLTVVAKPQNSYLDEYSSQTSVQDLRSLYIKKIKQTKFKMVGIT